MNENKCQQCGTPGSPGAKYCESCGAPLLGGELASPAGPPESQTGAQQGGSPAFVPQPAHQAPPHTAPHFQSVGIRFVATIIDLIIGGIIAGFVVFSLQSPSQINISNVTNTTVPMVSVTQNPLAGLAGVITALIFFVYYWLLEGTYGQTVGKMAVKIKVLREDGSKISYADAAARNILRPIDLIPFFIPYLLGAILIWASDKKQRAGDRVAHTIVVKA